MGRTRHAERHEGYLNYTIITRRTWDEERPGIEDARWIGWVKETPDLEAHGDIREGVVEILRAEIENLPGSAE